MSNVPLPTFGANGFTLPSSQAVLAGVMADINAAFGGNLNADLTTPQGQLATSIAAVINSVYQTFQYYTQQVDPAYASGRMQDAIGRIYFLERNPALPTTVQAVCAGLAGVNIPLGALAVAVDGNQYACIEAGTIPATGSITLAFACTVEGPIPCPAGTLNQIYQAISGWDSITNAEDGALGADVESRTAFEARRQATVAANSVGSLPAVLGAVLGLPGVLDAYVTENPQNTSMTVGGVTLVPNSIYVAAVGGDPQAIAQAIWSKKAPGCAYNGNTSVTVQDTSASYVPPYPTYQVAFEIPDALPIVFSVVIANSPLVPSNAAQLIQNAIINAFAGGDGGPRVKIGTTVYASRFYAPIAALGAWAQIVSIQIGSSNTAGAAFTGSVSGTTLTVSSIASGALAVGQTILDGTGDLAAGTSILSQSSGAAGGVGTYVLNNSQMVTSEPMTAVVANGNSVGVHVDQVPSISAGNINVTLG